jgi:Protein phosphatase 2C
MVQETKTEKNNKFHYGVAAMQGWRISMVRVQRLNPAMVCRNALSSTCAALRCSSTPFQFQPHILTLVQEDAHVAALNFDGREDVAFFGVYDGHGGAQVAKFCAMHMPDELLRNAKYKQGDIAGALKGTYLAIDERLRLKENAELLNQLKAKSNNEGSNGFGVVDPVDEGTQGGANRNHFQQTIMAWGQQIRELASQLYISAVECQSMPLSWCQQEQFWRTCSCS